MLSQTLLSHLFALSFPLIPISDFTPGSVCTDSDPDFKEFRYAEQIPYCERNVSSGTKRQIYEAYNIPLSDRGEFTIDHLIPLSIGGSNNKDNLWPEHKSIKAMRMNFEMELFTMIRNGEITQQAAIEETYRVKLDENK